jgi:XXXCH domain-containing protein
MIAMNQQQQNAFKSVKQRLSAIQLVIKKDLKDGQLPRVEDADQFSEISDEMDHLCQKEWRAAMDDYKARLGQFQTAMEGKDLQAIKDAFQRLLDCKASCHKKFRQK